MLKRLKKGFTLAELLIVVAIIAVLTAIAVPLFVGALNDAEKRVGDANIRSVRGAAVVYILENQKMPTTDPGAETTDKFYKSVKKSGGSVDAYEWKLEGPWYAYAVVSAGGEVSGLVVDAAKATGWKTETATADKVTADGDYAKKQADGTYHVYVTVTALSMELSA